MWNPPPVKNSMRGLVHQDRRVKPKSRVRVFPEIEPRKVHVTGRNLRVVPPVCKRQFPVNDVVEAISNSFETPAFNPLQ